MSVRRPLAAAARALPIAPERVVTYDQDVADPGAARGAVGLAEAAFGADVLFTNAEVMTSGEFVELGEAGWAGVLGIDVRGIRANRVRPG